MITILILLFIFLFTLPGRLALSAVGLSLGLISEDLPIPVMLEHKIETQPAVAHQFLRISVQNTGGPGEVTVYATQGSRKASTMIFLRRGDRKDIVLELVGFTADPFEYNAVASETLRRK